MTDPLANGPTPLVVMAGRDRHDHPMPDAGSEERPLEGLKGLEVEVAGRPIVVELVERMAASGHFDPILVAGPASAYRAVLPEPSLIDTDGELGVNLRAAMEGAQRRTGSATVAFTTCDILPERADLERLVADFRRRAPLPFWMPVIRVPADPARLGASAWKPQYRFAPEPGAEPVATLPGHLIIVRPDALRLPLIYKLFELAYRTRNRSVTYRLVVMTARVLTTLLWRDLRHLASLEWPTATWEVVGNGFRIARALQAGSAASEDVARLVSNIFVRHQARRDPALRPGALSVLEGLSFAKDADTEEEAREIEQRARRREGGARTGRPDVARPPGSGS